MNPETAPALTPAEARAALGDIEQTLAHTRRAIAQGHLAPLLVLWGALWVGGFTFGQFYPVQAGWGWLAFDLVGVFGSWFAVARGGALVRKKGDARIGFFWIALMVYATIWMFLLLTLPKDGVATPDMHRRTDAFWATVPMFGYVVGGLWLDRFLLWLGLGITVLTIIGYLFITDYFSLWLAVTGGGALIGAGLFIRKFWK